MLQIGIRGATRFLTDHVEPYFANRPVSGFRFLDGLLAETAATLDETFKGTGEVWEDGRELATAVAVNVTYQLVKQGRPSGNGGLERLEEAARGLKSLGRPGQGRSPASDRYWQKELRTHLSAAAEALQELARETEPLEPLAERLRGLVARVGTSDDPEPRISHQLLTPTVRLDGPNPHLIVRVHYIQGQRVLRDLRTEVELLQQTGLPLKGAVRQPPHFRRFGLAT